MCEQSQAAPPYPLVECVPLISGVSPGDQTKAHLPHLRGWRSAVAGPPPGDGSRPVVRGLKGDRQIEIRYGPSAPPCLLHVLPPGSAPRNFSLGTATHVGCSRAVIGRKESRRGNLFVTEPNWRLRNSRRRRLGAAETRPTLRARPRAHSSAQSIIARRGRRLIAATVADDICRGGAIARQARWLDGRALTQRRARYAR